MIFNQPYYTIAFHSCDKDLGLKIIAGADKLNLSQNKWDWLGPGIYFWEQNPSRALQYVKDCANKKQYFAGEIKTPFVIGAIIELGHCLNLVDPASAPIIREAHELFEKSTIEAGKKMPVNNGANRPLDCAVIKSVHATAKRNNRPPYQTIRSPFHEGDFVYPTSNFTENLHIEICVIDADMIKGYFLPIPHNIYNPYLNASFIPQ
ncbi:MAG: hypothetical protein ABJB11_04490 [Ferruginibacter sp.]